MVDWRYSQRERPQKVGLADRIAGEWEMMRIPPKIGRLGILCSLSLLFGTRPALSDEGPSHMTERRVAGVARNSDGQLIYHVRFIERWRAGRLISLDATYTSPTGVLLMRRRADWTDAEFFNPQLVVDHPLVGTKYIIKENGRRLGRRKRAGDQLVWASIRPERPSANEATTHLLIGGSYEALAQGQTVRFSIVAPSRLDWYRFRAQKVGYRMVSGRRAMAVRVQPDAFLIRMFADNLLFLMDETTH
ncbi:MAG: hypothetical protein VX589_16380, partial [Myxococcota bacterium]|nr:hypothetical protein [Myxococcota bacterium]